MRYYRVIPSIKLPYDYLTYGADRDLKRGQLVSIPIRNKMQFGIIDREEEKVSFDASKIKLINEDFPYQIQENQLKLLNIFAFNTFNKLNISSNLFIQPFKLLPQKDIKTLRELWNNKYDNLSDSNPEDQNAVITDKGQQKPTIEYSLENNPLIRIRYIIRNSILTKNTLFLFPEQKLLTRYYNELVSEDPSLKKNIYIFNGQKNKSSKETLNFLLRNNLSKSSKPFIIFGLRSSLFLPFGTLHDIICLDEGNPFYIQEQNSVYYDTRDTVFLLSNAFTANLTFLSTVPSIRLQKMYSESVMQEIMTNYASESEKRLKIKITNPQAKFDKNSLFSDDLEEYLDQKLDDDVPMQYFDEESID